MASSILLLFSNPDGFFRRDPKEWEGLAVPAALVLLAGFLTALAANLQSGIIAGLFPEDLQGMAGMGPLLGAFSTGAAFIGTFVAWGIYTAVFYVISLVFMGKGGFRRTLAGIGYGFMPTIIGNLISLILLWFYLPGIQVSPVKDVMDLQAASLALMQEPVFQMITVIGVIFLLWSTSIWIFSLRYSRELTLRNAAITAGVPVLIYLIIILAFRGVAL